MVINHQTFKNLIEKICTFQNAISAYIKARKCKRLRPDVLEFEAAREENLQKAIEQIKTGSYQPGRYRVFKVWEPKERVIMALPFFDRVIQHIISAGRLIKTVHELAHAIFISHF